jgi:hypothetical protein
MRSRSVFCFRLFHNCRSDVGVISRRKLIWKWWIFGTDKTSSGDQYCCLQKRGILPNEGKCENNWVPSSGRYIDMGANFLNKPCHRRCTYSQLGHYSLGPCKYSRWLTVRCWNPQFLVSSVNTQALQQFYAYHQTVSHWMQTDMSAWPTGSAWECKSGCDAKKWGEMLQIFARYWKFQHTQSSVVILARQWTPVMPYQSAAQIRTSGIASVCGTTYRAQRRVKQWYWTHSPSNVLQA